MLKRILIPVIAVAVMLVAPAFLDYNTTFAAFPEDATYIGNNQCKVCHNKKDEGAQWTAWTEEAHAKAFETLKGDAAQAIAKEKGLEKPAHESPECLRCHVTGYDVETKAIPDKLKMEDGVQCESCHGPGSLHQKDGKVAMFSKDKAAEMDMSANHTKITAELCKTCHNTDSPTWDAERYTLEDGSKTGFDYEQAKEKTAHPNPKKAEQ